MEAAYQHTCLATDDYRSLVRLRVVQFGWLHLVHVSRRGGCGCGTHQIERIRATWTWMPRELEGQRFATDNMDTAHDLANRGAMVDMLNANGQRVGQLCVPTNDPREDDAYQDVHVLLGEVDRLQRALLTNEKETTQPIEKWIDAPLPEDADIDAAFPTRSGRHDLYVEAMRLVGARRSKASLVALVVWLLLRAESHGKRTS